MTYPQPRTSDQIAAGARQWRLYTQVQGQGEIYEIDNSATAIALGPESDFSQIGVSYLDTSVPATSQATIRITGQQTFAGLIAPRLDTTYPVSPPRKGRMLVSLIDNFNVGYHPHGFATASMQLFRVPTYLDLIGFQTPTPPTLPAQRSDKSYLFQSHPAAAHADGGIWYLIPSYGRKLAYFHLFNNSGVAIELYEIRGINYSTVSNFNPSSPSTNDDEEAILVAPKGVANGAVDVYASPASKDGFFDAYGVFIATVPGGTINNAPLRVSLSDLE